MNSFLNQLSRGSFLFFLVIACCFSLPPNAKSATTNKGTDFWVAFPNNIDSGTSVPQLLITSEAGAAGVVAGSGFSAPFTVPAGSMAAVAVPPSLIVTGRDIPATPQGIHVTVSSGIAAVYGLNYLVENSYGFLGLPTSGLGDSYMVCTYKVNSTSSLFTVVGTASSTSVTIKPSITVGTRTANQPYVISLNQGDTYQLQAVNIGDDLSGTMITTSPKTPIAVFGGNRCEVVPVFLSNDFTCNPLVQELWPLSDWGTDFFTLPLATRSNGDTVKITASQKGTTFTINGSNVLLNPLKAGEVYQQELTQPSEIISNYPIFVAQYANSDSFDTYPDPNPDTNADPAMIAVPPVTGYDTDYLIGNPPVNLFPINYENIVAPTSAVGSISLDGAAIPAGSFSPIGAGTYSGAQVPVSGAPHQLTGPAGSPFGVVAYGFASADAYGYPGGVVLQQIPTPTVTFTPTFTPTPYTGPGPPPPPVNTCQIHLWPDPYNPQVAAFKYLKLDCIPPGATVSFYTVSGELVNTVGETAGIAQWDGKNKSGVNVSAGIYFYAVVQGGQFLAKGKFLILRSY